MDCINPIYKLVEYLNTQITSTMTDDEFLSLLTQILDTQIGGYQIPQRSNTAICCPDCPTDGGTYFLGDSSSFSEFSNTYLYDSSSGKDIVNHQCCINFITTFAAISNPNLPIVLRQNKCCNNFSKGYLDRLLISMEQWYDFNNTVHTTLLPNNPYASLLAINIIEYSVFNGDSAINDIVSATELIQNESFRFIFLMYILNEGLVITCSECAQANNTINIMTTSNFIVNCLVN